MEPKALEMMEAMLFVLCDEEKRSDALFVHGRGDGAQEVLFTAYEAYIKGLVPKIILNGLTGARCKELNLDYVGYEQWVQTLHELGVPPHDILLLSPSNHTAAESENFLLMAKEEGWTTLTIVGAPYHQLRCFLQIVASMERLGIDVDVYNLTFHNVNWAKNAAKLLLGGGEITGTRVDQIVGEYERILKYADRNERGFIHHATVQEMFTYLNKRNQRKRGS